MTKTIMTSTGRSEKRQKLLHKSKKEHEEVKRKDRGRKKM